MKGLNQEVDMTQIPIGSAACDCRTKDRHGGLISRAYWTATLVAALVAFLSLGAIRAQAPASQSSLSGLVLDPSGARIPEAIVYLRNSDGGIVAIDQADNTGQYAFRGIAPGHYEVDATAQGFARMRAIAMAIDGGKPVLANLDLEIGDALQSLTVTGTGPGSTTVLATRRIRVGGNVQAAKLVSKVAPVYPPGAEAAGVEGSVTMRPVISTDGTLLNVTPTNNGADPRLALASEDAVRNWRYEPTLLNGKPVEVSTIITIAFRLKPGQR
jgi:TonB family protein